MNKIIKLITILCFIGGIFAQNMPVNYKFSTGTLAKASAEESVKNPVGNSATDLVLTRDIIWVLTNKGLSKSTDNGANWVSYPDEDILENESAYFMDYDNGVLWCSFGHRETLLGSTKDVGGGLVYTIDEGVTWYHIEQPVDAEGDTLITYGINNLRALPVTSKVNNITWDVEVVDGTIWIASFAGGLRKSSDMGQNWERVVLPPDELDSISPTDTLNFSLQPVAGNFGPEDHVNHRIFSVEAVNKDTVLIGTAGGINITFDGGMSWKKVNHQNQANGIVGNFVTNIAYNPVDKSIWASCRAAEGQGEKMGVSYSYDFGETWTTVLEGYKAHYIGFKGTDVFVPTTGKGMLRTSDGGKTWAEAGKITDSQTYVSANTLDYHVAGSLQRPDFSYDIWLGSVRGLTRLNETGNAWEGDWKVFFETGKPQKSYAFPNPFRPKNSVVNIKYFLQKESGEVTIRIFDFGMNLVRTVIQNTTRNNKGEKIDTWDGKDDYGKTVPNGVYFYRVDVDSDDPVFGKILVVL